MASGGIIQTQNHINLYQDSVTDHTHLLMIFVVFNKSISVYGDYRGKNTGNTEGR